MLSYIFPLVLALPLVSALPADHGAAKHHKPTVMYKVHKHPKHCPAKPNYEGMRAIPFLQEKMKPQFSVFADSNGAIQPMMSLDVPYGTVIFDLKGKTEVKHHLPQGHTSIIDKKGHHIWSPNCTYYYFASRDEMKRAATKVQGKRKTKEQIWDDQVQPTKRNLNGVVELAQLLRRDCSSSCENTVGDVANGISQANSIVGDITDTIGDLADGEELAGVAGIFTDASEALEAPEIAIPLAGLDIAGTVIDDVGANNVASGVCGLFGADGSCSSAGASINPSTAPASALPTGGYPSLYSIGSALPSSAPVTSVPASATPASSIPASSAPASSIPASSAPASSIPASSAPASSVPASSAPASSVPASSVPASSVPASSAPASSVPASSAPASSAPASSAPASSAPASSAPASSAPASSAPASSAPASSAPASSAPASTAPASSAPASTAPASSAPASTAPASSAPASTAPASTAPASTAPASTAPAASSAPAASYYAAI